MIAYIKGKVARIDTGVVIIEAAGIGYAITITKSAISRLKLDSETQIHTYMSVKEDGITLFGFLDTDELMMFNTLLSVPGVGPKAAMSLLDSFKPEDIINAVLSEDYDYLSKAQGIGKKTAQMLTLRLKDKLGDKVLRSQALALTEDQSERSDAIAALSALGYSKGDALRAVLETALPDMTTQQIISAALRKLSRR